MPRARYKTHLSSSTQTLNYWFDVLKVYNQKPSFNLLDKTTEENRYFWEYYYINLLKSWNFTLMNYATGHSDLNGQTIFKAMPGKFEYIENYQKELKRALEPEAVWPMVQQEVEY